MPFNSETRLRSYAMMVESKTFRIVGEDEADPKNGSISHVSPLARSLFNKRVGDTIKAGNGEAEILAIK